MTTLTGAITQETARFIVETTYDDLPDALRAESLRCIVDGIGVMLAGVPEECTQIIHRYVGSLGVTGAARVPGIAVSYPAEFAALAAGVSGHAHDFDDTQLASTPDRVYGLLTHPTVPALSAALAVGQETGASGKDLCAPSASGWRWSASWRRRSTRSTTSGASTARAHWGSSRRRPPRRR